MKHKQGIYLNYAEKVNQIIEKVGKADLSKVILPNLMADFAALRLAGISIGESNYNLIQNILKGMVS